MAAPNSKVTANLLRPKAMLVGGEDWLEFLRAAQETLPGDVDLVAAYRCYAFHVAGDVSIIWTGIGTGCLEPLLHELLELDVVKRFALVGTAGRLPHCNIPFGMAHLVSEAHLAHTALDDSTISQPLLPRLGGWTPPRKTVAVSTDVYYGFGARSLDPSYRLGTPRLRSAYLKYAEASALVDMESAQFYYYCERLGGDGLTYASFKAAANAVDDFQAQSENTITCLKSTAEMAMMFLAHSS